MAYFVPPSAHFAGIERVVHEIATGLAQEHGDVLDVHVLFATDYAEELLEKTAYTKHVLGVARLRGLASTLRAVVARQRFDVLVCPQVEASVIAWLATRGLHLPVYLAHLHGNPRLEEREGTRRTRVAFLLFRHLVSPRIAGVLAVSPSLARYAAGSVARRVPVRFVKNPVRALSTPPLDGHFSSRQHDSPFRFLSVGRLSRQKGQDNLLRALALARPDLPAVTLTLVGSGPEHAALERLCAELGLDDLVTFAGYTADPAEHFRAADCFVLASRWEGFGVVLIEALQFGLPLLATDCEFGPADVITDPRIGVLVAPDGPEALAAGLIRMATAQWSAADQSYRRVTAEAYSRHEATSMHFEALTTLAAPAGLRLGSPQESNSRQESDR